MSDESLFIKAQGRLRAAGWDIVYTNIEATNHYYYVKDGVIQTPEAREKALLEEVERIRKEQGER